MRTGFLGRCGFVGLGDAIVSHGYGLAEGGHFPGPCTILVPVWTLPPDPLGAGFVAIDFKAARALVKNPLGVASITPDPIGVATVTPTPPDPAPVYVIAKDPVGFCIVVKDPLGAYEYCPEP